MGWEISVEELEGPGNGTEIRYRWLAFLYTLQDHIINDVGEPRGGEAGERD